MVDEELREEHARFCTKEMRSQRHYVYINRPSSAQHSSQRCEPTENS